MALPLDKDRLAVVDLSGGVLRQPLLEREVGHHAGVDVVALQRHGGAMYPLQIAALFQQVEILPDGDFRDARGARQLIDADPPAIVNQLQYGLLS